MQGLSSVIIQFVDQIRPPGKVALQNVDPNMKEEHLVKSAYCMVGWLSLTHVFREMEGPILK